MRSTIAYSTGFRSHSSCVPQPLISEVSLTKLEGGRIFNCSGKEFRSREYFGRNRRRWKETVESWQPSRRPLSPFIAPLTTETQRYFIHFDFFDAPQSLDSKVSVKKLPEFLFFRFQLISLTHIPATILLFNTSILTIFHKLP